MIVPDALQQHGAGHHLAGVAHQVFQQAELARLQVDLLPGALHLARQQVELEVLDHQLGHRALALAAPGQRLDPRQQLGEGEGLGQVVVAARLQAVHPLIDLGQRRQDQHRHGVLLRRAASPGCAARRCRRAACGRGSIASNASLAAMNSPSRPLSACSTTWPASFRPRTTKPPTSLSSSTTRMRMTVSAASVFRVLGLFGHAVGPAADRDRDVELAAPAGAPSAARWRRAGPRRPRGSGRARCRSGSPFTADDHVAGAQAGPQRRAVAVPPRRSTHRRLPCASSASPTTRRASRDRRGPCARSSATMRADGLAGDGEADADRAAGGRDDGGGHADHLRRPC